MISKRQQSILEFLKKQQSVVSMDEIAEFVGCSNRTVRSELDKIEALAKTHGLMLIRKPSLGVMLHDQANAKWEHLLNQVDYHDKTYRQRQLLLYLLMHKQCTLIDIADKLQISRQTITRDLNQLVKDYPLLFKSFTRSTHGCFFDKEECVVLEAIKNTVLTSEMILLIQENKTITTSNQKQQANRWLQQIQHQLQAEFEAASFLYLESLITLYLLRSNFAIATERALSLEMTQFFNANPLSVNYCAKELVYQALLGARLSKGTLSLSKANDHLAMKLYQNLSTALGIALTQEELTSSGLLLHLQASMTRIRSGQRIDNPLLKEIRVSLGLLYEVVVETIKHFEVEHDLVFSEDEIGFVAMHLGALMQSQVYIKAPIKIAIVCQHGMATSRLLLSRVKALLPNHQISGPYSLSEFLELSPANAFDYVITTIALGIKNELVVHAILTTQDIDMIEKTIWNYTYWKQCDILINNYRVNQEEVISMSQMIKAQHIRLSDETLNYKQAIKQAASLLLNDGIIENRYIEKMIWAVETLGPYMVILPEVAFVHAAPEDGVNRNGISLLRLSAPIAFGKSNTAPVQAIFVIASKNKEDQGLLKLVKILEAGNNTVMLLSMKHIEDIIGLKG